MTSRPAIDIRRLPQGDKEALALLLGFVGTLALEQPRFRTMARAYTAAEAVESLAHLMGISVDALYEVMPNG